MQFDIKTQENKEHIWWMLWLSNNECRKARVVFNIQWSEIRKYTQHTLIQSSNDLNVWNMAWGTDV
jgi:hypothetical protein